MGYGDTHQAIAAITAVIHQKLAEHFKVQVGAPRQNPKEEVYLFLYETLIDGHMRNYSYDTDPKFNRYLLSEEKPPLVWIVLKYLLIAYDEKDPLASDYQSYTDMGLAIRVLNDNPFVDIPNPNWIKKALTPNLERLKITFDPASHDILSKILGDITGGYQFCLSFQVRPVMIAAVKAPPSPYRVGVDSDNNIREDEGIFISTNLEKVSELNFDNGDKILNIKGIDVCETTDPPEEKESRYLLDELSGFLGTRDLELRKSSDAKLDIVVKLIKDNKSRFSANAHILKILHKDKPIYSKLINLVPFISNIRKRGSDLEFFGSLLGTVKDLVFIEFYQNNKCLFIIDEFEPSDFNEKQVKLTINLSKIQNLIPEDYKVILQVNNQKSNSFQKRIT